MPTPVLLCELGLRWGEGLHCGAFSTVLLVGPHVNVCQSLIWLIQHVLGTCILAKIPLRIGQLARQLTSTYYP